MEEMQFHSCEHLQLIPSEEDAKQIKRYIQRIDSKESNFTEMLDFLYGPKPFGRYYEPHCRKLNGVCVCLESPVMAIQHTGGLNESLFIIINNSVKIRRCPDREEPQMSDEGKETLMEFLLKRVLPQFADQVYTR